MYRVFLNIIFRVLSCIIYLYLLLHVASYTFNYCNLVYMYIMYSRENIDLGIWNKEIC